MNSLTPEQLQDLAEQLKRRRAELKLEVRRAGEAIERPEIVERAAMADALAETEVSDAEVERDIAEILEIDAALERMARGRYGVCTHCGAAIGLARLQAEPSAERCIDCQREHERRRA